MTQPAIFKESKQRYFWQWNRFKTKNENKQQWNVFKIKRNYNQNIFFFKINQIQNNIHKEYQQN